MLQFLLIVRFIIIDYIPIKVFLIQFSYIFHLYPTIKIGYTAKNNVIQL